MLAYTLNRLLEKQQAILQRDMSVLDAYGGDNAPDWQQYLTVPVLQWWDRSVGARSANRTYVAPAREIPVAEGAMLIPLGTDVTEEDQVITLQQYSQQSGQFETFITGPFQIVAVMSQVTHLEISLQRIVLGA